MNDWKENDNKDTTICIEDIIEIDPNNRSSRDLLQYICTIAYFVQVIIDKKSLSETNLKNIRDYYTWVSNCLEILAKRIKQPLIETNTSSISRSSYNFCQESVRCSRFYNVSKPSCNFHHYVHSLLKSDIDSILNYIDYWLKNGGELDEKNIISSIKTICFVSRHMSREINYIHYITNGESENHHRSNTIRQKSKVYSSIKCENRFSPLFQ